MSFVSGWFTGIYRYVNCFQSWHNYGSVLIIKALLLAFVFLRVLVVPLCVIMINCSQEGGIARSIFIKLESAQYERLHARQQRPEIG